MAKTPGSKKVAHAAALGGDGRQRKFLGFPALVVAICLLGSGVVALARIQREAEARPGLSDHWHIAYTVWDCTEEEGWRHQPVFEGRLNPQGYPYDPEGIHSHSDGIIHIHPFTANATGQHATMKKFFESMFVTMDENGITADAFGVISAVGAECDGQPAVMQIVRWSDALNADEALPDERIYENFEDVRFQQDGEALTIALAPRDAVVPLPPSVSHLLNVSPSLVANLAQPEGPVEFDDSINADVPGVGLEDN